jgi:hypothetical protein
MNGQKELEERLLEGFSASILRSHFSIDGTKKNVIDSILRTKSSKQIESFVANKFGTLHQHIYALEKSSKMFSPSANLLTKGKCLYKNVGAASGKWIYLYNIDLSYYCTQTFKIQNLSFLLPVKIESTPKRVLLYFNTLARDLKSYFNYQVYPNRTPNLENIILDDLKSNLVQTLFPLDLNKGIKELWKVDYLDALSVRNKKSKSMRQERMDEDLTFKKQYPNEWSDIMLTPIQKTKFISLKSKPFVERFECNPSIGFIGITSYSEFDVDVNKLVSLILKNN